MEELVNLFKAIEQEDESEALRILEANSESEEDTLRTSDGLGPLRVTVLQLASWTGQTTRLLDLLYRRGAEVNDVDKLGRCALHYAAQRGNVEPVKWLLGHGALVNCKFGPAFCTREDRRLKEPCLLQLHYSLGKRLPFPDCWGRTPLHLSVKHNHPEVTKLLLDAGAEPNAKDSQGITPILLAGSNISSNDLRELTKYAKIIQYLIAAGGHVNVLRPDTGTTSLHQACILGSVAAVKSLLNNGGNPLIQCFNTGSTAFHEAAAIGHLDILRTMLTHISPEHVNVQDKIGRTPLHRAAYQGHRDCVILLIENGGNLSAKTKTGITTIDAIFANVKRPLSLLEHIFDSSIRCISCSPIEKHTYINVDFGVLTPQKELQTSVICALINAASDEEQLSLLQHPLLELFLKLKWNKLRLFFTILVTVYICFTISVSAYSTVLLNKETYYYLSQKVLLFSSCILLFHNAMQIIMLPRYYYKQLETWISFLCSLSSLFIILVKDNNCAEEKCQPSEWKLHLISVVILFSWIHLMLLIGRFPTFGYYALMFYTVLKNLLKVLLAYIWLIVGFASSFSVLFHQDDQFANTWKAMAKTIVMMTGEYEYGNVFAVDNLKSQSFVMITGRIVFLGFVLLASIVLMNLMIGLAVSDIQALEQVGHIQRLLKQAEFVAHLERVTDHRICRNRWIHKQLRKFIESKRKIQTKLIINITGNLPSGNLDIPAELTENLIEIAKRNKDHQDEPDTNIEHNSRINFKRAINNIKMQLQVIEKFKFKERNRVFKKQVINTNIKRKPDFKALNV